MPLIVPKTSYSFVIVRYVHDTAVGEFVNIGVAVYYDNIFQFKLLKSPNRVVGMFPELDVDNYLSVLGSLEKVFLGQEIKSKIFFYQLPRNIDAFVRPIPPLLCDSFCITDTAFGITSNPQSILDHLYERMVAKHTKTPQNP